MLQRHGNMNTFLLYLLITIEIILITALYYKPHANVSFQNEPLLHFNNGWTFIDEEGSKQLIDLPADLNTGKDNSITISHKLPHNFLHMTAVSILSTHQSIYAYIENDVIFSKEIKPEKGLFNVPSGYTWIIIPLPKNSEGKTLTLRITSNYHDYAGKINEIHIGTKSSLLVHNIRSAGLSLLVAFITLMNGFLTIIAYLFLKKFLQINRSILYIGLFSIFISIWSIMESNLTQIFLDNEYVISSLSYLSLMTLPIPIVLYITLFDNFHYTNILRTIASIFEGSAFLFILLQVFNVFDFHKSAFFVKSEILILFCIVIITLILELCKYKNKDIKSFTISVIILFLFGAIEIITFELKIRKNSGVIFQLGFLVFNFIIIYDLLKKLAKTIKLSEAAWHYKSLATKDYLTNCRNRTAYARDMAAISLKRNITIFVADMNNMKIINDSYGHYVGDDAIIQCSKCLLKVFGKRVYRIGGDEFVSIQYDLEQNKINSLLNSFYRECNIKNEILPYQFQMTLGYAVYNNSYDETIYDTVKRADLNMYENKRRIKNKETVNGSQN